MASEILIVDDEADIRALVSGILEDDGFHTREADSDISALERIETRRPHLVLLDIWLQGSQMDGIQILSAIQKRFPGLPVVMMSGHGTVETAVKAIQNGAYDFIEKPFKADRMVLVIERAIEAARLKRENQDLRLRTDTDDELIGLSSTITQIRQTVERVAPTNSRILICGPSGSGKEVVGRMIHDRSNRSGGPFVIVNCASMEPEHIETELFGSEANTDDDEGGRKVGYFESAHMGTLFLDEITDMPLEIQGKIVRVLQEQIFQRVGGNTKTEVDVRVIASASQDLELCIENGSFRKDLFFRLSVVPISVPALIDRREDIPPLAAHFLAKSAQHAGQPLRKLTEDTIAALQSYDWPGNVRELKNVMERLLILAPGDSATPIRAEHLPGEVINSEVESSGGNLINMNEIMGLALKPARELFERDYLNAQVSRFGGNISRTAEFIGMERSALHRKLKSLGLTGEGH